MREYDGKSAVITGGSSGFGLATARLLTEGGARVLITGRDQAGLNAARERLGDNAMAVRSDVASAALVKEISHAYARESAAEFVQPVRLVPRASRRAAGAGFRSRP